MSCKRYHGHTAQTTQIESSSKSLILRACRMDNEGGRNNVHHHHASVENSKHHMILGGAGRTLSCRANGTTDIPPRPLRLSPAHNRWLCQTGRMDNNRDCNDIQALIASTSNSMKQTILGGAGRTSSWRILILRRTPPTTGSRNSTKKDHLPSR
jgi:hypothetical protein